MNNYIQQQNHYSVPNFHCEKIAINPTKSAMIHLNDVIKSLHSFLIQRWAGQHNYRTLSRHQFAVLQSINKNHDLNCLFAGVLAIDSAIRAYVQKIESVHIKIENQYSQLQKCIQEAKVFNEISQSTHLYKMEQKMKQIKTQIHQIQNIKICQQPKQQLQILKKQNKVLSQSLQKLQQKYKHVLSSQVNSKILKQSETEQSYGINIQTQNKQSKKVLPIMRISVQILQRKVKQLQIENAKLINSSWNSNSMKLIRNLERQVQTLKMQNRKYFNIIQQYGHKLKIGQIKEKCYEPYYTKLSRYDRNSSLSSKNEQQSSQQNTPNFSRNKYVYTAEAGFKNRQKSVPSKIKNQFTY